MPQPLQPTPIPQAKYRVGTALGKKGIQLQPAPFLRFQTLVEHVAMFTFARHLYCSSLLS